VKLILDWSVELCPDRPYLAPELHDHFHLFGVIDGKRKMTSRVIASAGRSVTTKSGTTYHLGRVSPKYRTWMTKHGMPYDPRRPVKPREAT
jgi:hypothetical protein